MKLRMIGMALVGVLLMTTAARAETHVVEIRNFEFSPAIVNIEVGDIVRWEWTGGTHSTTSGLGSSDPESGVLWNSGVRSSGASFEHQFNSVGTFPFYCIPHEFSNMKGSVKVTISTGVLENFDQVPGQFYLAQNHPNPFNPSTTISFGLEADGQATVTIFNLLGQEVVVALDEVTPAGSHEIYWDGRDRYGREVPSGIYFYRLQTARFVITRKMALMR